MQIDIWFLFLGAVSYLGMLFLVAYSAEQGKISNRVLHHPVTYVLSLGVYATSWTYYGSVGLAESGGLTFLTVYLGVTIAFLMAPVIFQPVLNIVREYQLASLADLFAFRYHGQASGFFVTLFMMIGILPYISLQIQAVTESIQILTREAPPDILALVFCVTLTAFAILFGARHLSQREKHEGLVAAIAFESAVKLIALLTVGAFAIYGVFDGFADMDQWAKENPQTLEALYRPVSEQRWTTLLLLSFCAAFLLPRQFHMMFTENLNPDSLRWASWMFPLFLLLLNLPIIPILWAGQSLNIQTSADSYVLGITLANEAGWLSVLAFIGGISAASAMMIVTTLALASMCLNHLFLPISFFSRKKRTDLYQFILWGKRAIIAIIIAAGYAFYRAIEHNEGLAQLGLISFVAVAQLLPGFLGMLFWPRATQAGFLSGLAGGALIWFGVLIVPMLVASKILSQDVDFSSVLMERGPDIWTTATFWSLTCNGLLFAIISLITSPSKEETDAAEACFSSSFRPLKGKVKATSPNQFQRLLAPVVGKKEAKSEVVRALDELGLQMDENRPAELRILRERIERNLSGLLGPVLARLIVDNRLRLEHKTHFALADSIRHMETQLEDSHSRLQGAVKELDELRRYHRDVLHELPMGVCSLSDNGEILIWNYSMRAIAGIESRLARGRQLVDLPEPWNIHLDDFARSNDNQRIKQQFEVSKTLRSFNFHKAMIASSSSESTGGMVILVEERTALDLLETELAHNDRLASIGRFAAGIAHEIGNPLTGITSIAQNLPHEETKDELRQSANDILSQTHRISDIVKSLLAFSHGESISNDVNQAVSLNDCLEEAIRLVRLSHSGKQMAYQVPSISDETQIKGDRQRLLQVFVNLLTNATDASPKGAQITITMEYFATVVTIAIHDRGHGIAPEHQKHIFEPFFTTKPVGEGTGLGLPLVHSIIEDHRGGISINSHLDQGTSVFVTLPLYTVTSH